MADAFREVDEALREDRAVTLAKRYGPILAAVLALIIAGVGGWTFWQSQSQSRAEARTAALAEAVSQLGDDPDAARQALADVAAAAEDGPAMLARFYQAQILVQEGQAEQAAALYDQISGDASVGPIWRNLAAMHAALLVADTANSGEMEARLSPFLGEESPWRFTAMELMALATLRSGDHDAALSQLETLRDASGTPASMRQRTEQLIDRLQQ